MVVKPTHAQYEALNTIELYLVEHTISHTISSGRILVAVSGNNVLRPEGIVLSIDRIFVRWRVAYRLYTIALHIILLFFLLQHYRTIFLPEVIRHSVRLFVDADDGASERLFVKIRGKIVVAQDMLEFSTERYTKNVKVEVYALALLDPEVVPAMIDVLLLEADGI